MIVAVLVPNLALKVALLMARRPSDRAIALAPPPGAPQLIGPCTATAFAHGVRPGLTVGEALARCPLLELVTPDPGAVARAAEQVTVGLEAMGAAVDVADVGAADIWCFSSDGLERLHGGLSRVLQRARAAVWVGADPRIGVAKRRFVAMQAARDASSGSPNIVPAGSGDATITRRTVDDLPLDQNTCDALRRLGITRIGEFMALPGASVLDRFGKPGHLAWQIARGAHDVPLRPRTPPVPLVATMRFHDAVAALAAIEDATRMLLRELATEAVRRGRALRTVTLRATLDGGGSWTHTLTLRTATADPERLALAALPHLTKITAPVDTLSVSGDASGPLDGHQLALVTTDDAERRRRNDETARHIQTAVGRGAILRLVELEPWSRLPERRWALVPFTGSHTPSRST